MADTSPASFSRTRIAPDLLPDGAVLIDQLRERTSWYEGMFVTSQHFNRDQSYMITRQGDLGQAIGKGVVQGLGVSQPDDDPSAVVVAAGLGIGGGGESIVLHNPVRISLANVSLQKSLTQSAGLEESLQLIAESRSGLFILCATPVEYTSNPVGSYATAADGQRKLEDSVVNEATLFTLIPYSLTVTAGSSESRRALAARRIFVDGKIADIPATSLPLAMLELDGNVLVWLDEHLVRRDAGAARADAFGLGFVDTPGRIAHYRQYEETIREMVLGAPGQAFAAHDRFEVLPPMGPMPAACVTPREPAPGLDPVLSHNWLPAEMPVELVALPEDEIDQLLEESLSMPPIDLGAQSAALAQTPVSIIIPIPREDWAEAPLEVLQQTLTLKAAAPLGSTPTTPMQLIESLLEQEADQDLIDPTVSAEWLALLAGRNFLWYARRRQFLRTDALTGEAFRYRIEPPDGVPPPDDGDGDGNGDGGGNGDTGGGTTPLPPVITVPMDVWNDSVITGLRPWGLENFYRRVKIDDAAREGVRTRAELNSDLTHLIGVGSAVGATDVLHRALADPDPETLGKLRQFHAQLDLPQFFVPLEGMLTGGAVELEIAPFTGSSKPPTIRKTFANRANAGVTPVAVTSPLEPPSGVLQRVDEALGILNVSALEREAVMRRGGGLVPLKEPRDREGLHQALKVLVERRIPFYIRQRDPGSIEAQTRRNLLALTDLVPKLMEGLNEAAFVDLMEPLLGHLELMNDPGLFQGDSSDAVQKVTESVEVILGG